MHRFFFTEQPLHIEQCVDLQPLCHQLSSVLRLTTSTEICLLDGQGNEYIVALQTVTRQTANGVVLAVRRATGEPTKQLTLYQCSLKADKFEWVLQKGVELGVSRFVPVISERSIVRPAAALLKKYGRWRAILREAAEQCGRARIPTLDAPLGWAEAAIQAQGLRLLPWEAAAEEMAPSLGEALASQSAVGYGAVNLAIGPEGGLTQSEVAVAREAGWRLVSLGPRTLRAETAALCAVTIALDRLGELRPQVAATDCSGEVVGSPTALRV